MPWRPTTIALALVIGVGSVVLVTLNRRPELGLHHLSLRVAINTAAGIGAFAAAWLMRVRYTQSHSRAWWLLMTGLGCYAFTALFGFGLPVLLGSGVDAAGAPVFGRLLAGVLLAAAAFAGNAPMRRPPSVAASVEFAIGASAASAVAGIGLAALLPAVFIGDANPRTAGIEHASALYVGVAAATIALYLLGGATLWARAAPRNDSTVGWLAIGAALIGTCRLDVLLAADASPSLVSVGDFIRLAATAAFVAAAFAEFHRFEQRLTDAVAADERRRLARELHDGVAQDLAFVVSHTTAMARRGGDRDAMRNVADAAQHAMADSRRAIHLLSRPRSRALSAVLAERAYELCSRSGLELDFAMLGGEVHATPEVEHAVVKIVSEAVSNAVKHARARTIRVELSSTGGSFTVRVSDDGCGFDTEARPARRRFGGFGLISMAERAHALGGDLRITSDPAHGGTSVEVAFN